MYRAVIEIAQLVAVTYQPIMFDMYTLLTAGWTQKDIDVYDGPTPKLVEGLARNVQEKLKATYCVGEVCSCHRFRSGPLEWCHLTDVAQS